MTRSDMLIRAGFYASLAIRELGDDSFAREFIGRAERLTEERFSEMTREIMERLVAAGKLRPDEDPFDTFLAGVQKIEVVE